MTIGTIAAVGVFFGSLIVAFAYTSAYMQEAPVGAVVVWICAFAGGGWAAEKIGG